MLMNHQILQILFWEGQVETTFHRNFLYLFIFEYHLIFYFLLRINLECKSFFLKVDSKLDLVNYIKMALVYRSFFLKVGFGFVKANHIVMGSRSFFLKVGFGLDLVKAIQVLGYRSFFLKVDFSLDFIKVNKPVYRILAK